MLRPPRGCSTLGSADLMRVPWPAARTTTAAMPPSWAAPDGCGTDTDLLGLGRLSLLGDSDSNRDFPAPKAGGLPITPSPTAGRSDAGPASPGSLGVRPGRDSVPGPAGGAPYGDVAYGPVPVRRPRRTARGDLEAACPLLLLPGPPPRSSGRPSPMPGSRPTPSAR